MGCGSSNPAPATEPAPQAAVQGQMVDQVAPAAGKGKGKGGKGKGKGKGSGKWQIKLGDKFQDYEKQENSILMKAYMLGHPNARFELRGQKYEYNFKKMKQMNKGSGKERQIRPPQNLRPPKKPLLPEGPMTVITIKAGQPGQQIDVPNPGNKSEMVKVYVPAHAKPGQKLAVPLPQPGESIQALQQKQQQHDAKIGTKTSAWSTGGKVAAGGAAVAGLAAVGVGGVILGDHLAGGDMATTIGEGAVDAAETVGDGATDAVDAVGDWAPGAADDAGDWAVGAVDDAGEWLSGAAEDAGDWLGDAGEDVGDFVMDLF